MNARLRLSLMTTAVVVLGVLVVLVAFRGSDADGGRAEGISSPGSPFRGSTGVGAPSPDFRLRDQNGRPTSLADLRGKPAIVTFMYSTCEDTCPAVAQQVASALDDLGRDSVPTLIVSTDPKNDTERNAQLFLNKHGLRGRATFALGSRAQLAPIWRAYGIQPQGAGFEHTARVLVLDDRGRQKVTWPVDQLKSDGLAHDVRAVARLDARAR